MMQDINEYGEHNTTIERMDVNGNYCPENCKWATYLEQANNTRKNVRFNYRGVSYSIRELSNKFNINPSTLKDRLRRGIDLEHALHNPVKKIIKGGSN